MTGDRPPVLAASGTWLAELAKMGLALRAMAILLTLVWLPGAVDVPILLACIFGLTATTGVALLRWDRAAPRIARRPTLFAGDVLLTGSPAGNAGHHGNRWLVPGDVMEGTITGLGVQRNRCVAA